MRLETKGMILSISGNQTLDTGTETGRPSSRIRQKKPCWSAKREGRYTDCATTGC